MTNEQVQIWPLAPLQEGLLFHALGDSSALDVYAMQSTYHFDPAPAIEVVSEACQSLVRRHDVLRAGFTTAVSERPVQFIPPEVPVSVTVEDVSRLDKSDAAAALDRIQRRERQTRFVMDRPPLIRFVDVRLPAIGGAPRSALIVTNHHILYDGWSDALLVTELLAHIAEGGHDRSLPAPASFGAYLGWLSGRDLDGGTAIWRSALEGVTTGTLVADSLATETVLPGVIERDIGESLTTAVHRIARDSSVSASTVYSAAWGFVLRSLTGNDDVLFGTTVSGRPAELANVETMIGLFLNTVPQRVRINPHDSVRSMLRETHRAQARVLDAHEIGLGAIQQAQGVGPLFDTLYVMRNTPQDDDGLDELSASTGLTELDGGDATHYPLTFIVHPGENTRLILSYREDSFTSADASDIIDRTIRALDAWAADPDQALGGVRIVDPAASERWLAVGHAAESADTDTDDIDTRSLIARLEASVRRYPHRRAVFDNSTELSFADLWTSIVGVSERLTAAGVAAGELVGIDVPRGTQSVVAILGVLAHGAAYVPVDQSHPAAHRGALLRDVGVRCVIGAGDVSDSGAQLCELPPLVSSDEPSPVTAADLHPDYDHSDVAYVIFTSGSTGKPKAVQIAHAGLVNMLDNHRDQIFIPAGADAERPFTAAHAVSFAFDMSWEELLWLIDGHSVLILNDEARHDPDLMLSRLTEHSVDVINVTPSLGSVLVQAGLFRTHSPRLVLLGGEAVTRDLWDTLRSAPDVLGYNLYGPTEYTINTLGGGTSDSATPIVGRPIARTSVYILDSALQPVAPGTPGELWVTGIGLAHGYRDNPALTAERFVACPFGPSGARMYRTGDIVVARRDGQIDFIGRQDGQVKIRGHRVEPNEVQAAVAASPLVASCAVVAATTPAGTTALVAYIVPDPAADDRMNTGHDVRAEHIGQATADRSATARDGAERNDPTRREPDRGDDELVDAVRAGLRSRLPEHLVPASIIPIERIPLTVNSKLDRSALPEPNFSAAARVKPEGIRETRICEAFAEALGIPEVGAEDNLFSLGGHSLTAMRAATLASQKTGERISVGAVMSAATPRALARQTHTNSDAHAVILPLRSAQRRSTPPSGAEPVTDGVVFIHGALGIGWSFSTLAARLPSDVFAWALQSPGLSGWQDGTPTRAADLVAVLADEIATRVAREFTTPVRLRLIGWSFGAHLAGHLEAALDERGISVSDVVLLDPGMPTMTDSMTPLAAADEPSFNDPEQEALRFLVRASGTEAPDWLTEPYHREDVLEHLTQSSGAFAEFTEDELDSMLRCFMVNAGLLSAMEAQAPLAPTTLVSATHDTSPERVLASETAWAALASATDTPFEALRIDIDHESFTTPSTADLLTARVLATPFAPALTHQGAR